MALLFAMGCSGWPLYANLPVDTAVRVEAGSVVTEEDPVAWTELSAPLEDGSDDDPRLMTAETLSVWSGNWFVGRLNGSGWDPTATQVRWEQCEDTSEFPPYENGDYIGDTDWRVIDVQEPGVLCSWFRFNQPGGQADVLVYQVNECNLPTTPLKYGEGVVVGYNVAGQTNSWSYPLLAPQRLAIVSAAWAPNDAGASWVYQWGLSLLPAADTPEEATSCSVPPQGAE